MKVFWLLLAVALAGVCSWAQQAPSGRFGPAPASSSRAGQATCDGKTLSEWTSLANDTKRESPDRGMAVWALRNMGPKAIPALTELLKDKDAGIRGYAAAALGGMGFKTKTAIPALT